MTVPANKIKVEEKWENNKIPIVMDNMKYDESHMHNLWHTENIM